MSALAELVNAVRLHLCECIDGGEPWLQRTCDACRLADRAIAEAQQPSAELTRLRKIEAKAREIADHDVYGECQIIGCSRCAKMAIAHEILAAGETA